MKKTIKSPAALIMMMTAMLLFSCSKNDMEISKADATANPVTLTILPPQQTETRVAISSGESKLNITGWSSGDKVIMYKYSGTAGNITGVTGVEFTCTDAAEGKFTGDLAGTGINDISEFSLAVYNAEVPNDISYPASTIHFIPKRKASKDVKDVIVMAAIKDGDGNYQMQICGNILKATNGGAPIEAAVKYPSTIPMIGVSCNFNEGTFSEYTSASTFSDMKFKLDPGVTYVYLPMNTNSRNYGLGKESDGEYTANVVNFKEIAANGKMYKKTITMQLHNYGIAKRNGNIEVTWVQLWENGPRFATYNVGASSVFEYGGYYNWGGIVDNNNHQTVITYTDPYEGTEYDSNGNLKPENDTASRLWGNDWRMPTDVELQTLFNKCNYAYIEDIEGIGCFIFYGKEGNYSSDYVCFPAAGYSLVYFLSCTNTDCYYWTSTPYDSYDSDNAKIMHLDPQIGSVTFSSKIKYLQSVRAVYIGNE